MGVSRESKPASSTLNHILTRTHPFNLSHMVSLILLTEPRSYGRPRGHRTRYFYIRPLKGNGPPQVSRSAWEWRPHCPKQLCTMWVMATKVARLQKPGGKRNAPPESTYAEEERQISGRGCGSASSSACAEQCIPAIPAWRTQEGQALKVILGYTVQTCVGCVRARI